LRAWRNARESTIETWTFTPPDGQSTDLHLGDFWPVHTLPVTLTATGTIPADWSGQPVELELWLGGEAFIQLSTGLQAGLNPMHHRFLVTESATGGEQITIVAEAVPKGIFGTNITEPRIERAHFVIPQRDVRALERDLSNLRDACLELADHEVVPYLLGVAEDALDELADGWPSDTETMLTRYVLGYGNGLGSGTQAVPGNWVPQAIDAARPTNPTWSLPPAPSTLQPLPATGAEAVERARAAYAEGIAKVLERYPPVGSLVLTGHAHIDLAWLWPVAETRRKTRRTFSTVLNLMDQYPDFVFNQSSAQAYKWMEEDDPALLERIKERVAEGRWEPIGGMWLEPDCMVTGGEALSRQIIEGQRYFEQTFGKRHTVAWLPDVFGFSAGMPQILRLGGITGFFTIKVNWNETNQFPADLFVWEGIDGSQVTAHTFFNPGEGYNGNIVPLDTLGTWRNFRGKTKHPETLLAFGWGDGAGGPSEKMLENYARIKEFPALPRLRMGSISEFFASLPDPATLPKYIGELYLELHRGTLTTQGQVKLQNRQLEQRLVEAEAFGTLALANGFDYPSETIQKAWQTLLLNQFHDILPGSSIHEVYEVTHREMTNAIEQAVSIRDGALDAISGGGGSDRLVANPGLADRPLLALLPGVSETSITLVDGTAVSTQVTDGGVLIGADETDVAGLGWRALRIGAASTVKPMLSSPVHAHPTDDGGAVISNDELRVTIAPDGTITQAHDKHANRDALAGPGNQLVAYLDKPRSWDAWDVDETYERNPELVTAVDAITVIETGPLRASVRVERTFRSSRIVQTYRLAAGSMRLDIETDIDWHERQVLLRTRFPMAVRSHEATFETMYGAFRRATHRNTTFEQARFEVGAHRWVDISEPGYGVALLNNGKYGHAAHENVLSISLVRGPMYPDWLADEGEHHFTYSLYPHAGDWTESGLIAEAQALNSPLVIVPASAGAEDSAGFAEIGGLNLALGALKPAFDGNGTILRVYEPHGRRGSAKLTFALPVQDVTRVDLLEDPLEDADPVTLSQNGQTATIAVRPFEIITLRIT
jgi:alpha-mannosidase